ncbi:MAG: phage holin family protein [Vicinamibacterales bacterium]|jgi:hypothetical protein|nr:phage holin family protein [Vicinamibacterales bacterium]MCU0477180.1 phage holin family protein [Chloroflexota bacterium]MCU0562327.1 phage holin family protein [Desulfobacterales bacterium]
MQQTIIDWLIELAGSPEFTAFLLTTFAGIVTAVVGWVGVQFRKRILRELSASDLALLRSIAVVAVQYVEQKFKEAEGPTKLAEAIRAANTMISSYGLNVTVEQLTAIVEAAVYAEIAKTELPEATAYAGTD